MGFGGTGAANQLDDYEEGTFTPSYGGTTGDPTATYVSPYTLGRYTKVGNMVHCDVEIRTSSISGGSGELEIKGFPFTAIGGEPFSQGSVSLYRVDFNTNYLYSFGMQGNSTRGLLRASRSGATSENIFVANVNNANPSLIRVSVSYKVS